MVGCLTRVYWTRSVKKFRVHTLVAVMAVVEAKTWTLTS
jgi:hypothetical protein